MRNAGLEETQAGIKIAGRNINHLRYADDTTLRAESEEELKSLLMKVKDAIFPLLQWSRTEPTISLRYASTGTNLASSWKANCWALWSVLCLDS